MDTFDNVASEAFLDHSDEIITILGGPKQILSHFMSNESLNMDQITALKTILLNTHETTIQSAHQHPDVIRSKIQQTKSIRDQELLINIYVDAHNDAWYKLAHYLDILHKETVDHISNILGSKWMIVPWILAFISYTMVVMPSIPNWWRIVTLIFVIILCFVNCLSFNIAVLIRMLTTFEFIFKVYNVSLFMICRVVIYNRFNAYDFLLLVCSVLLVCMASAHDGWRADKLVRIFVTVGVFLSSAAYYMYWFLRDEYDHDWPLFGQRISMRRTMLNCLFNLALFVGKQGSSMIINYRNNISTVLVTRPYLEWVKDWDTNSPFVSSTSLINNGKHIQIASRGA
eukprot:137924_1